MEFKGKKGKWVIDKLSRDSELETLIVSDEYRICGVKHYGVLIDPRYFEPNKEMGKANALLISKAPEMLEMLKDILTGMRGENFEVTEYQIEQLIKEATDI